MPRVTCIIPTYNWSSVLPFSIGSVLRQTFSDFELLVIGDGCTDDSEAVVRSIEDPRVRWINIPRTGHQFGPNNEGLRQAAGNVIAYLGHDDLWLPHRLEQGLAAIDRGADLAHSLMLLVPSASTPTVTSARFSAALGFPPSCVMHTRALAEEIGPWRDHRTMTSAPDHEFFARAQASGARFEFVPRLAGVKFSAAQRRNVYQEKPAHEQARWWERIRTETDFEPVELARVAAQGTQPPSFRERAWNLLRDPGRWWVTLFRGGGARLRREQRLKGVRN
jgi:glycosyltransferase involved in cell wall biosynthesis